MQNEVQLIVKSGGIVYQTNQYTIAGTIINGATTFSLNSVLSSPLWLCISSIQPKIGGTFSVPDADVNNTAIIIGYDPSTCVITLDVPIVWSGVGNPATDVFIDVAINTEVEYFLDLYPNESISLSYQFTDLNNFSQIGTFSRDFRIPATKKNVEALGPLYDYNFVDDVQSFSRKYTAELRVDTIPISRGYIRVMAAYKQQDFLSDFQVAFYSEAPNFVKSIGEKKLKDLTVLPTLSEPVVFTNVTTINSTRIWALIDRGQGGKAFSETGETNTRPTQNDAQPLYAADLTPCLRSDYILQQIFNDAGFELDASSLLTTLSDYYVPWVNTESLNFNFAVSDNALRVTNSTAINHTTDFGWQIIPLDNEDYDNGMNYNAATYTYTTPYTGYYSFRLYFTFENASCWTSIQLRLKYNDGSNDYYISFGTHQPIVFDGVLGYTSGDLFFSAGWTIQFQYLGYDNYSSVDCPTPNVDLIANGFVLELMNLKPLTGPDIIYSNNAPDIKQIDFVSDIIKMHNLAVIPDAAGVNKLLLEPMSTYLGSGSTLDWTKKLDTSKDIVIKGTDDIKKSKLYFTYSAGQDTYSKLFVDQGRIYGDYKLEPYTVDANQVPSEFLTGNTEVKLIAQSTPSTQVNGSSLICPRFWTQSGDEPPKFTAPGLRFLYWSETAPIYLYDEGFGGSVVYQNVPLVNHYNDTSGFNPNFAGQYDLNWAPETPLHDYTMNPQNNLFTQYWRDYLDSIYSDDARILEASFALNNTDILSLNFGDYIFVKDAYWRIIELSDYKMGQYESTRVKLLKVSPGAPAKPACDIIPVSNNQDGSVNFETPAGASVSATQYCCNYFNFTWSVNTNLCYGKVRDRPGITNPNNDSTGKGEITSLNSISVGANNVITTVGLDAGSSTFSVFAGNDIKSGSNDNVIAVGDTLEVKGDQRGIAMFGKSVESAVPGLVVGGGWPQDDRTYAFNGSQSAGTFMMSEQGTYAATLGTLELFIEGIANKRIELEDNTAWYMRMQVMVQPTINQYINATITAQIGKSSGIAFATAPIVQYQDTSMAGRTVNLIIDTATNTAQHRMNIQLAGGTYPFITRLVAQINYTQFR
jgi:hypothetical protein